MSLDDFMNIRFLLKTVNIHFLGYSFNEFIDHCNSTIGEAYTMFHLSQNPTFPSSVIFNQYKDDICYNRFWTNPGIPMTKEFFQKFDHTKICSLDLKRNKSLTDEIDAIYC